MPADNVGIVKESLNCHGWLGPIVTHSLFWVLLKVIFVFYGDHNILTSKAGDIFCHIKLITAIRIRLYSIPDGGPPPKYILVAFPLPPFLLCTIIDVTRGCD